MATRLTLQGEHVIWPTTGASIPANTALNNIEFKDGTGKLLKVCPFIQNQTANTILVEWSKTTFTVGVGSQHSARVPSGGILYIPELRVSQLSVFNLGAAIAYLKDGGATPAVAPAQDLIICGFEVE